MLYYENKYKSEGYNTIIGIDEVGRGPLAGPVVAAAVILGEYNFSNRIDDSKKLSAAQREKAFFEIAYKAKVGVGIVSHEVIDEINILQATKKAMRKALDDLLPKMGNTDYSKFYVLVDGDMKLDLGLPYAGIIKGDAKSLSIASASIMAKVSRDRLMDLYHRMYPDYGFKEHKGYPTLRHKRAIREFGFSNIHRLSFRSVE